MGMKPASHVKTTYVSDQIKAEKHAVSVLARKLAYRQLQLTKLIALSAGSVIMPNDLSLRDAFANISGSLILLNKGVVSLSEAAHGNRLEPGEQ